VRAIAVRVLFALLALLAVVRLPQIGFWPGVKPAALMAGGAALALLPAWSRSWPRERLLRVLRSAPTLFTIAFVGWVAFSAANSDLPWVSRYEALRHLAGALLYFGIAWGFSSHAAARLLFPTALLGGVAALVAMIDFGNSGGRPAGGAFVEPQILAGFLCMALPLTVAAVRAEERPLQRTAAMFVVVLIGIALLGTRNRSAWAGAAIAVAVLPLLALLFRSRLRWEARVLVVPVLTILVAGGLFLGVSREGGRLLSRAATFVAMKQDGTFQWRVGMWRIADRMARERPVFGWGAGTFAVNQALYSMDSRSQREILMLGPSLTENAHNTYLQLAAELGYPGLALYAGILFSFLACGVSALRSRVRGKRRWALIGCLAAVAGQMVCAVGSPAWEFPECSAFLWLVLGIGMALSGGPAEHEPIRAERSSP